MKNEANILILDDDEGILSSAKMLLKQKYTFIQTISDPTLLHSTLSEVDFHILLLDMNFSTGESDGKEGLDLIDQSARVFPELDIIAITAYGEIDLAVSAVQKGARDFITKPWRNEKLLLSIENILEARSGTNLNYQEPKQQAEKVLVGKSRPFVEMLTTIKKVANTDASVLIRGENGTGKELVANEIHKLSNRSAQDMVSVDLGALTPSLLESELFGHKKGAFTDAVSDKDGKFRIAHQSTLFLDEIGNLPIVQQSKLLTALQERRITPVGSNEKIEIDIRLITATNASLEDMIVSNEFRQDLLYRINTIEVTVPPLRERSEDIALLLNHYLKIFKTKYKKKNLKIEKQTIDQLQQYKWPGNVRELAQAVERAVILSDNPILSLRDFQLKDSPEARESLDLKEMEKGMILKALEKNKGNITHAAKDLGIDRLALYRRLEKYGL